MLLDNGASNIDLALWYLDRIDEMSVPDAQARIDNAVAALGLTNWTSAYTPGNTGFPAWYAGTNTTYSLFIGDGTQGFVQGTSLLEGYIDRDLHDGLGDCNTYIREMISQVRALPFGFQLLNANVARFAGKSLGGALALGLAVSAWNLRPRQVVGHTSFGAPKTGGQALVAQAVPLDVCRWMNSDDPVPLVPPTVQQAPLCAVAYPVGQLRQWANQRHAEGGIQLDSMGGISPQTIPQDAVISPSLNLATWLVSVATDQHSPHRNAEYRRRLLLYRQANQGPDQRNPQGAPREIVPQVGRSEIIVDVVGVRRSVVGSGITQARGPLIIPKARLFQTRHYGKTWYVTFGGIPVAVGPRRKKAGLLAQAGNLFLARIQREAYVDPIAFDSAFQQYLDAARNPSSGIKPTLNTGAIN